MIFGDWKRKKDFVLFNHITKQYIYSCRNNYNSKPAFNVFLARLKLVIQLEFKIAEEEIKLRTHPLKWGKVFE